eukprot:scaffold207_cov409-Prasinococcus_capsulatus_cf.AAC.12
MAPCSGPSVGRRASDCAATCAQSKSRDAMLPTGAGRHCPPSARRAPRRIDHVDPAVVPVHNVVPSLKDACAVNVPFRTSVSTGSQAPGVRIKIHGAARPLGGITCANGV